MSSSNWEDGTPMRGLLRRLCLAIVTGYIFVYYSEYAFWARPLANIRLPDALCVRKEEIVRAVPVGALPARRCIPLRVVDEVVATGVGVDQNFFRHVHPEVNGLKFPCVA